MTKPTVQRLLEFQELLANFAQIERVIHIKRKGKFVKESDTEHSYNLAMTAWFLAVSFPDIDASKVIMLALVHDLVEIHAGDTFAYGTQKDIDTKAEREAAAKSELAKEWPDFPMLHDAIEEYESLSTPEARFVYALDKIMPPLTLYNNEGHTWHKENLRLSRINKEKIPKVKVSPEIKPYWDELYKILLASPHLLPPED